MEEDVVDLWSSCSEFNCYSQHKPKPGTAYGQIIREFLDGTLIGFYPLFYVQARKLGESSDQF